MRHRRSAPPMSRFEKHVSQQPNGCWEWMGNRSPFGYGWFYMPAPYRRQMNAHRAAWLLLRGDIQDGLVVCHKCDNPPCVNPDHLFLGTQRDNITDMRRKGRQSDPPHPRHERHPNGKLSLADKQEIVAARARGIPGKELAARYGVTQYHIYQIAYFAKRSAMVYLLIVAGIVIGTAA